jgi:hypothetical protein
MAEAPPTVPGPAITPTAVRRSEIDPFSKFADQDLTHLISVALNALQARGLPPLPQLTQPPPSQQLTLPAPPPARVFDMWDNAKVEQIICAGLKPQYDGSPEKLIPTLNLINLRRRNEVWLPATFLNHGNSKIDLVMNFSQVTEAVVLANAKRLWDAPDAHVQSHTRGTDTYNNQLLGMFLMNSLISEFAAFLYSRIDATYCSDGLLLLYTMCQNIHHNHLVFVESIKQKIRQATLVEYNHDVPAYLRFLKDNLKLISSTGAKETEHNYLVPHLLLQLRSTNIPVFQQTILKWQREYFEGTLVLTPTLLATKADQECQILKHASQWVETIDPSVVAMQAMFQTTKNHSGAVFQSLAANFSSIAQKQKDINRSL